jgi:3-hydroxyisobutyrate dehydrogenase-like beta-hydroxyacid dehydrogenase
MNNAAETIGFISVDLMGHGIAKNLLNAGYPVYVLAHHSRAPVEDLLSKGAQEVNAQIKHLSLTCS